MLACYMYSPSWFSLSKVILKNPTAYLDDRMQDKLTWRREKKKKEKKTTSVWRLTWTTRAPFCALSVAEVNLGQISRLRGSCLPSLEVPCQIRGFLTKITSSHYSKSGVVSTVWFFLILGFAPFSCSLVMSLPQFVHSCLFKIPVRVFCFVSSTL